MKYKAIARSERAETRECSTEISRLARNPAPELHPHAAAREQQRAVVAAKMEKLPQESAHPAVEC